MVLDETIGLLQGLHGEGLRDIRIDRIVIGVFFTGVKLSDGSGGVAYTSTADLHDHTCCPSMAAERPFPDRLKGTAVSEILNRGTTTLLEIRDPGGDECPFRKVPHPGPLPHRLRYGCPRPCGPEGRRKDRHGGRVHTVSQGLQDHSEFRPGSDRAEKGNLEV